MGRLLSGHIGCVKTQDIGESKSFLFNQSKGFPDLHSIDTRVTSSREYNNKNQYIIQKLLG